MAIIDPSTNRPVPQAAPAMPEWMTPEMLADLHTRIGQPFHAFGYRFRVVIAGPEGMAAEILGPVGKKKKETKKKKGAAR